MVGESQGKCKSDWKVREILGENFTFLYSCCNANNSRAAVQCTILLAVVVWLMQQFDDFIHTCANGELENFCCR